MDVLTGDEVSRARGPAKRCWRLQMQVLSDVPFLTSSPILNEQPSLSAEATHIVIDLQMALVG